MEPERPDLDPEPPDPSSAADPAWPPPVRGRGAATNPANRFVEIGVEPDPEAAEEASAPATRFYRDAGRRAITTNTSPDVGFEASVNPYRGCEHGCIYCYARPTHEYFGFSAGLDFETRIMVKQDAPALLRAELAARSWTPKTVALSGVTDPYQPVERRLGITRGVLEVLAEFRNPVSVITKNHLVVRDADLLAGLARVDAASVTLSITTLDEDLRRVMEPRTSGPRRRLDAIRALREAGVPAGVMVGPVIPGLTEPELPAILEAAAEAGATHANYVVLRLPHGVAGLFERWLEDHLPGRKDKVLNRIRSLRGGELNDPRFGSRMRGEGVFAEEIRALFEIARRRAGLPRRGKPLSTAAFRRPGAAQTELFED